MTKYLKYVPLAAGLLLAGGVLLYLFWGRPLVDKYSYLTGEYEALVAVHEEYKETALSEIKDREKLIKELTAVNEALEVNIEKVRAESNRLDTRIQELETEREALTDKDEVIANLEAQVSAWREKFSLARDEIEIKDRQLFNLTEKYEAQLAISNHWKTMFFQESAIRVHGEARIGILEKRLKRSSVLGRIKNIAIIAIGGFLVYEFVRR